MTANNVAVVAGTCLYVGVARGAAVPENVDPGHICSLAVHMRCHFASALAVLMVGSLAGCQGCRMPE